MNTLTQTLQSFNGDYSKLFTPDVGNLDYDSTKKEWTLIRGKKITNKQKPEIYDRLCKALSAEQLIQIQSPELLAYRINEFFQSRVDFKLDSDNSAPILFKSTNVNTGFLSNFFGSLLFLNGKFYPTSEHAYQQIKSLCGNQQKEPQDEQKIPLSTMSALKVKKMSKTVSGANSDVSNDKKLRIMRAVLRAKFACSKSLQDALRLTGKNDLIEDTDNRFWGRGRQQDGSNNLGKLLKATRDSLP